MYRYLLLACLWITTMPQLLAQNYQGHWVHKYGLHLDLSDSTNWRILNYCSGQCTLQGDTLTVRGVLHYPYFYMGSDSLSKMNSEIVQNPVIFHMKAYKDSVVLTPLNHWARYFISDFGMSHAPMMWHLTPERPDYFPKKTNYTDKLVFYTPEQMADTIPWDKLYFSMHRNQFYLFPESNFDITILRTGLVQVDWESLATDAYAGKGLQERKSYQLQLSATQMDSLVQMLVVRNFIVKQGVFRNISVFDTEFRVKFGEYDALFSWVSSVKRSEFPELETFMNLIINHPAKKEIPFAGYKSPCSFVKIRN